MLHAGAWDAGDTPVFYSDSQLDVLNALDDYEEGPDQNATSQPLAEFPTSLPAVTADDAFYTNLQQVSPFPLGLAYPLTGLLPQCFGPAYYFAAYYFE